MDTEQKPVIQKKGFLSKTMPVFLATSLIIVSALGGLGLGLFIALGEMDRDLAYMGVYFNDLGGNLTRVNASQDAVDLAYGVSGRFCEFYQAQMHVMGEYIVSNRYAPVCNSTLENTTEAADIAAELRSNPPYFGLAFNYIPKNRVCSREMGVCGSFVPENRIAWW
jgi:hypothetical protein